MDQEFAAHYRVLSVLHGSWPEPEIRFAAFDHYGTPGFARYETVLLYVSRYDGELVHQKYLFSPLERTRDGGWASCASPYLNRPDDEPRRVAPKLVTFASPVRFPLAGL